MCNLLKLGFFVAEIILDAEAAMVVRIMRPHEYAVWYFAQTEYPRFLQTRLDSTAKLVIRLGIARPNSGQILSCQLFRAGLLRHSGDYVLK